MKLLLHCMHLVEAHHRANLLRSAGIHAEVRNTFLSGAVGDIPYLEAGPQVWIDDRQDAELARSVIAQAEGAPTQPDWRCKDCGEAIEGQFAQCWNCGTMRPFDDD